MPARKFRLRWKYLILGKHLEIGTLNLFRIREEVFSGFSLPFFFFIRFTSASVSLLWAFKKYGIRSAQQSSFFLYFILVELRSLFCRVYGVTTSALQYEYEKQRPQFECYVMTDTKKNINNNQLQYKIHKYIKSLSKVIIDNFKNWLGTILKKIYCYN